MSIRDYRFVVSSLMRSSLVNRVTLRHRGFMTLAGAKRYLGRIRSLPFCLSAWID